MGENKNRMAQDTLTGGSVGVFNLFGVPIRLHFTFILLLVFLLFVGIGERQSGASTAIYILALFVLMWFPDIALWLPRVMK